MTDSAQVAATDQFGALVRTIGEMVGSHYTAMREAHVPENTCADLCIEMHARLVALLLPKDKR